MRLSCVPVVLFEVPPYFALAFLLAAFPPMQTLLNRWHGDFIFGFLGGVSIVTLIFPRGRRDGWPGAIKAWGLGLFLGTVALDVEATAHDTWQHFVTLFLVSIVLGLAFYRLAAHRQEAERQRELADLASQAALRAKLAPHFIFNTLNTLHAQIEGDPRAAQATTERLAQLFRQVIAVSDEPVVSLKQEMEFIEAYLGIEQARLGDRLRVRIEVAEELEAAEIPPLSLQVLAENAVKHGIAPLERGGEIRIAARREGVYLVLEVCDPGDGIGSRRGTGTALDTLRRRLARPEDLTLSRRDGCTVASFRWRQP